MAQAWKPRHLVVAPSYLFPSERSAPGAPRVTRLQVRRRHPLPWEYFSEYSLHRPRQGNEARAAPPAVCAPQLYVFGSAEAMDLKTVVALDGATLQRLSATDAVLVRPLLRL